MGKYLEKLNQTLLSSDKTTYHRYQYQSFMTGPEWRNVEMAKEFAEFLQNNHSMFYFPYFSQVLDLWKVFFNSYYAARKYDSAKDILSSEYMMMDVFVSVFTSLELIPKAILANFLSPFLRRDNPTEMQKHFANYYARYANDLQTIPFYDQNYAEIRTNLGQAYAQSKQKTWGDWFSWSCISAELSARYWISKPLHYWFHQENNLVPPTTDVLVKFESSNVDIELAKQEFIGKLAKINNTAKPAIVNSHIYTKQNNENKGNKTSVYALLRASRYATFQPTVKALGKEDIQIRKIAGQDHVQVKCIVNSTDNTNLKKCVEDLNTVKNIKPLYTYQDNIHPHKRFCLFNVPVKNLAKTINELDAKTDTEVNFIHNF